MSSPLPRDVRDAFDAEHKDRKGRYRCADCRRLFMRSQIHIDHIKAEAEHPELKHVLENLQPLCIEDHKRKTAKEASRRAGRRRATPHWKVVLGATAFFWGLAGAYWALLAVAVPDAAPVVLEEARRAFLFAALAYGTFRLARWWAQAAPKAEPAKEEVAEAQAPAADPNARVVDVVRDVVGARGEVTVSGQVPKHFTISYAGSGFEDHKDDRRLDFMSRLSSKLGERLEGCWDTKNDRVDVKRRPDLPALVPHPGFWDDRPWNIVPIAHGISIDFSVTSHVLVIGPTNTGKTVVIRSIVEAFVDSARRHGADVRLADPKMVELLGFRGMAGITELATSDEELWQLPLDVREEMDRRYSQFRDHGTPLDSHRPMLVLIDEYEEFVDRMEAYWPTLPRDDEHAKKTGMKNPCLGAMKSVLRLARKANIHVVIGTQRPDASWFGGSARDNLQGRVGVGRLSADAARMCFGTSEFGRDVPLTAKGRLTVQVLDHTPVEAQGFWVPDRIEKDLSASDKAILERLAA